MATITEKLAGVTREIDTLSTALQGTIVYFADANKAVDDLATKTDGLAKQLSGVASAMANSPATLLSAPSGWAEATEKSTTSQAKQVQDLIDAGKYDVLKNNRDAYQAFVDADEAKIKQLKEERDALQQEYEALTPLVKTLKGDINSTADYEQIKNQQQFIMDDIQQLSSVIGTSENSVQWNQSLVDKITKGLDQEGQQKGTNEEWYAAITELKKITDAFQSGQYQGAGGSTAELSSLLSKLSSAWTSNAPIKTYQININGTSIKTIDDPTDLIALIEQLAAAKRRSL